MMNVWNVLDHQLCMSEVFTKYFVAEELGLGDGGVVPRQLLSHDPHRLYLANSESRHLEIHHD